MGISTAKSLLQRTKLEVDGRRSMCWIKGFHGFSISGPRHSKVTKHSGMVKSGRWHAIIVAFGCLKRYLGSKNIWDLRNPAVDVYDHFSSFFTPHFNLLYELLDQPILDDRVAIQRSQRFTFVFSSTKRGPKGSP